MIAEEMSIFESERSIGILREYGIPVEAVIVNQLIPENHKCNFCTEKRRLQQQRMKTINKKFGSMSIRKVPLHSREVKGMGMLEKVAGQLHGR